MSGGGGELRVERMRPADLAGRAAVLVADHVWRAVARQGRAHVALSGGTTPAAAIEILATLPLPVDRFHVWQVDERCAPDGDPARNARLLDPLGRAGATVHLMDAGAADPGAAARSYAARLPDHFDLVHLGIGDDGHAASWLPGTGEDRYREAVTLTAAYRGHRRMTLSPTVVRAARGVLFLVSGEGKRDAFDALLHGRPIPASWALGGPDVTVLTDLPEPADQPPV